MTDVIAEVFNCIGMAINSYFYIGLEHYDPRHFNGYIFGASRNLWVVLLHIRDYDIADQVGDCAVFGVDFKEVKFQIG